MNGPQRNQNIVRFRNVALEIPDLELLHIVRCFGGTVEEGAQVVHEVTPLTNPVTGEELQLKSDTRSLRANFPTNRRPYSFFGSQESQETIVFTGWLLSAQHKGTLANAPTA